MTDRTLIDRASEQRRRLLAVARGETAQIAPAVTLARLAMAPLPPFTANRVRTALLRAAGMTIGRGTMIFGPIRFSGTPHPAAHVTIGQDVIINIGCLLDAAAHIHIGDRVGIGQHVMILTNRHRIGPHGRRLGGLEALPVHIGDGAWLSTRAVVLPGITVGDGAVVAAGAVVTRPVPPDPLVAGVPARVVRELPA
jgi:maltose O-acetyltransferase